MIFARAFVSLVIVLWFGEMGFIVAVLRLEPPSSSADWIVYSVFGAVIGLLSGGMWFAFVQAWIASGNLNTRRLAAEKDKGK